MGDFTSAFKRGDKKDRLTWRNMSGMQKTNAKWGMFFISPFLIGFTLFYLVPMVASLAFSVFDFFLLEPERNQFVGLDNWKFLFTDSEMWQGLRVTALYGIITMPLGLMVALFLAILMNSEALAGRNIFRTVFYLPTMIPLIASVFIWQAFLNPQSGWLNKIIETLSFGTIEATGMGGIRWLDDAKYIYFALFFIGLWGVGNAVLLLLAALQGVPTDLYEASTVDGAGWWRQLFNITLPMITPVVLYNVVIGLVGIFQYFLVPYALNAGPAAFVGAPDGTMYFYLIHFFKYGFRFFDMGYGATLAWFLFLIALVVTIFVFWSSKFWVFYAGEKE